MTQEDQTSLRTESMTLSGQKALSLVQRMPALLDDIAAKDAEIARLTAKIIALELAMPRDCGICKFANDENAECCDGDDKWVFDKSKYAIKVSEGEGENTTKAQERNKNRQEFLQALDAALNADVNVESDGKAESCEQYCNDCPHRICGKSKLKPLTLEELRERDKKPVYCKGIISAELNNWVIVNAIEGNVYDYNCDFWVFEDYGQKWLAYDKEPREANNGQ